MAGRAEPLANTDVHAARTVNEYHLSKASADKALRLGTEAVPNASG